MSDSSPLRISINGEPRSIPRGWTFEQLLQDHGLRRDGPLAVECNQTLVPRTEFTRPIEDGDRIEIVSFVGGG